MKFTFDCSKTSTLWFLLPSFCLDTEQSGGIGLAIMFLNWQVCVDIRRKGDIR